MADPGDAYAVLVETAATALFDASGLPRSVGRDSARTVLRAVLPALADHLRIDGPAGGVAAERWWDAAEYVEGLPLATPHSGGTQ